MSDVNSLTAAATTSTVVAFLTFKPTPASILKSDDHTDVRINEAAASVVAVGLGVMLAFVGRSGAPLIASMVGSVLLVAGYEYLARTTDERLARERNERISNVSI